ncbi:hypothetical protein PRIPAC_71293 [Pristionchus pacificus]|uniref:Uncharacterized protein n=1 Tax=Pristionchus pacificus TaxID=54126 RepID=A0A2A6BRY1_PRIPA|nr:hypothetical protein PRIPAC_71293 [Pristionchus pacificus]|eukprot:PDM68553.1 hypothetical protein PRIPAC_44055 [Pristionchus pacificus]
MRSLSLLVLLIFTVVVRTSAHPPSTVLNRTLPNARPSRSPEANTPLMQDLLGPDGGKRTLRAYDGRYLTNYHGSMVALRSYRGIYLSQWWFIYSQPHSASVADEKAMFTPVKNDDGSWSFKTRGGKWMSAHMSINISLEPENKRCERWKVVRTTVSAPPPSTVPSRTLPNPRPSRSPEANTPLMLELLGPDGGRRRFKAWNGYDLAEHEHRMFIDRLEHCWYIEQINDYEVALKSPNGIYIDYFAGYRDVADESALLTPVKNDDGTWSFTNRWNKWLSGQSCDNRFGPAPIYRTQPYSTEPSSPEANTPLMLELLGPDGGQRTFKAYNDRYLTDYNGHFVANVCSRAVGQYFNIEQINDNEVALRSRNGRYFSQFWFSTAHRSHYANENAMLKPVKNDDGSFKNRSGKWMSNANYEISFESHNQRCERWKLESWN